MHTGIHFIFRCKMDLRMKKPWLSWSFLLLLYLILEIYVCKGSDTLLEGQSLSWKQNLISADGNFELGFFTPGNSGNYYLGIWYKMAPLQPKVWVANREEPLADPSSAFLKLLDDGNLVLFNHSNNVVWSSDSTSRVCNNCKANLLDNGNLIIGDALDQSILIWQSFDHPTDTWLPGGKIGYNRLTNEKYSLAPWRNQQDPAPSLYSFELEQNGTQEFLRWNRSNMYWITGEWTGKIFTLVPEIQENIYLSNFTYVSNENESYFTYASAVPSAFTRFVLDFGGRLTQLLWHNSSAQWSLFWARPSRHCEVYAYCGAFSICNQQKQPLCICMEGFQPKRPEDWTLEDHTGGCVRTASLECQTGGNDTFLVMQNMSIPSNSEILATETVSECKLACLKNCSCNAFAYDDNCLIWKGDLLNAQQLSPGENTEIDIHLRVAMSELTETRSKTKTRITLIVIVILETTGLFTICGLGLLILWRRRTSDATERAKDPLILFKYKELKTATKNFSEKLGEGGFGCVFKGKLPNSTAIAVKQLKSLYQEEKQFLAEVKTIGLIQHINVVRLQGFCVEASKRFLIYDFMPNGSLETLLLQRTSKAVDWKTRYHIAVGSAKGLAYLHEECRDCIIHCDIKPGNILLDAEFNPQVADFGLAKIVGRDYSRVLTTMRGTVGYLAPEWISGEAITPKADVFSYGMLLCEIISGRRNSDILDSDMVNYFPFQLANTVIKDNDVLILLDDRLEGNANIEELKRACIVACWCIQDDEKDRPTMRQVVQILERVLEVGKPLIPRFLERMAENSAAEGVLYEDISSSSC